MWEWRQFGPNPLKLKYECRSGPGEMEVPNPRTPSGNRPAVHVNPRARARQRLSTCSRRPPNSRYWPWPSPHRRSTLRAPGLEWCPGLQKRLDSALMTSPCAARQTGWGNLFPRPQSGNEAVIRQGFQGFVGTPLRHFQLAATQVGLRSPGARIFHQAASRLGLN